jgi:hypothetical protein
MSSHPDYSIEGLKPFIKSLAYELVNNPAVKNLYDDFLGEEATGKTIFTTVYFIISQATKENLLFIKSNYKKRVPTPYDAIGNLKQLGKSLDKTKRLLSSLKTYECDVINTQAKHLTNKQSTDEMGKSLEAIQNQINDSIKGISELHPISKNHYFSVVNALYFHFKIMRFDIEGITQLNPNKINHNKAISIAEETFFQAIVTRVFHEIYDYFFHDLDWYNSDHYEVGRGLIAAFDQVKE